MLPQPFFWDMISGQTGDQRPMKARLTEELQHAVEQNHGFLEVQEGAATYVVMSMPAYRQMMGVGSDAEYQASLQAIREGLADVEAGKTQPMDEFFRAFDGKHAIHD
jgi:hypothetical protein